MEDKILKFTEQSLAFISSITSNEDNIKEVCRDIQSNVIELIWQTVFELEPEERFEEAALNLLLIKSIYSPVIMFMQNCSLQQAEEQVDEQISELIQAYRIERDEEERKNNKNNRNT